jgi:hypothetical protein
VASGLINLLGNEPEDIEVLVAAVLIAGQVDAIRKAFARPSMIDSMALWP